MLKKLIIHHFAIIDHLELDFHPGLTVLTGETGAGKSILIDAISLLLGDRASQEMIRSQEDSATVEAQFTYDSQEVEAKLTKLGVNSLEKEVTIFRSISTQNKNIIKINNQVVTLQDLKDVTKHLADIHSQFDTQRLINPSNYIELVDGFLKQKVEVLLADYASSLHRFEESYLEVQELVRKKNELASKLEMYQFQRDELSKLDLPNIQVEELKNEESRLANFDQIYSLLQEAKSLYEDSEFINLFYKLKEVLVKVGRYQTDFKELSEKMNEYYYEIEDVEHSLSKELDSMNFDPAYLEEIQDKLHQIDKIEKKYQMTLPELINYLEWIDKEIDQSVNYDSYLDKANKVMNQCFTETIEKAKALTIIRRQITNKITKEIKSVLEELVLPKTEFEIQVFEEIPASIKEKNKFTQSGINQIELMISTNVGEPMKPLSKTASGGEMSRIMLAFKTIFIRSQNLSTMIFDEIDTGISGYVAKRIAMKLKDISKYAQVLSITHIPQVVAYGDYHLRVEKKTERDRTVAKTAYLGYEDRIKEIASMISGDKVTSSSLESAKELLVQAE